MSQAVFATFTFTLLLPVCSLIVTHPATAHSQPALPAPHNTLMYEIFVRSFCDADDPPKKSGNLKGITSKLDSYLNDGDPRTQHDLEVGILWLMPICPSPTYHGYDVTDYRGINPDYGTREDFQSLVKEAHKRGVRIIIDLPINHTSNRHPWFKAALADKNSPYRGYYHFAHADDKRVGGWHTATGADGEKLRYFGLFGSNMPDLNFNTKVRQEIRDIAEFWLDLGVDGFRLDAAKHIFSDKFTAPSVLDTDRNNEWWIEFSESVYRKKKDAILVGEVLGDSESYQRHAGGLAGTFGEHFMNGMRSHMNSPKQGFIKRMKKVLDEARGWHTKNYKSESGLPRGVFHSFDFVASHDRNPRLMSDLEEMSNRGMRASVDEAYRTALHALFTFSTRPVLYQGDEVMQRGWKWKGNPKGTGKNAGDGSGIYDETLREPFPWYKSGKGMGMTTWFTPRFSKPGDGASVEEQAGKGGMLDLVRGLSRLRTRHPTLANGDVGSILNDSADWMVFEKVAGKDEYLVLINMSKEARKYEFHKDWYPQYSGSRIIFWSDSAKKEWSDLSEREDRIEATATVAAYGLVVLRSP